MSNPAYELPGQGDRIPSNFQFHVIDDSPLLNDSYSLRYEVYVNERHFLSPDEYPEKVEIDEFDGHSIHIGGINSMGLMVATVRLVLPSTKGFPLLEHCQIYPEHRELASPERLAQMTSAEISRLAISKSYRRRKNDGDYGINTDVDTPNSNPDQPHRRQSPEIVFGIYRLIYLASKRQGITHWFAAMEKSLVRLLSRYNMNFTPIGPELDYYGPVIPYYASVAEMEKAVFRASPELFYELVRGLEPELLPAFAKQ
jgi:N-acyl amino acid synthase of PEP-CTERM/exosortase system